MDAHSNPRRALKSAQEQDWRWRRNERDRARCAAETAEQRSERLRKWKERDRARCAAQTASERQATSQQRSTRESERMAAETPEERERRSQRMSTNQHERLAAETPKERERLQRMSTNQHERLTGGFACASFICALWVYIARGLHPFEESSAIQHFERGIACVVLTFNTYTRLPHIYFAPPIHSYPSFPYPRKTGSNDAERTP